MDPQASDAKGTVPCRSPTQTVHPALVSWLCQAARLRLVVLTAPAGAGKTALLATVAASVPQPVVWYRLDRHDCDAGTFGDGLRGACRQAQPARRAALLDGFAHGSDDTSLVLANWQLVDGVRPCMGIVEQVLAHCLRWHVLLATRTPPSLQHMLMLAAAGQLCAIDADGLRTGSAPARPHRAGRSSTQTELDWAA